MQIILLSGGSGKRLWPLSNDKRSKQFLKLLPSSSGLKESMLQRVVRQLKESGISDSIHIATSASQNDEIINQLGEDISVITEPQRRDTFPAIALASSYLAYEKKCSPDEVVVVMPCDPYTEDGYYLSISKMASAISNNVADLVLMGIEPTYPSTKYGYIVPQKYDSISDSYEVSRFTEKPDTATAEGLIAQNAFWNGGVFAFKLSYMMDIVSLYSNATSFEGIREQYSKFPKISFDYEVVEKAVSVAVVPFSGKWKDLGTWNALTQELHEKSIGNVLMDDESEGTHVINELELPIMCISARNLIVAASHDGILISDKSKSESIKSYADKLHHQPLFEERHWGEHKIIEELMFSDGYKTLAKQVIIKAGRSLSYQCHHLRDESWTFVNGEGTAVVDGKIIPITRGTVINISRGTFHALKADTDLYFVEVQSGPQLSEEDIERVDWNWQE